MQQIDKVLFNNGFALARPGRLARNIAFSLIQPCYDLTLGTNTTVAFEALHDLISGLIANIEEQDRQIQELNEIISSKK